MTLKIDESAAQREWSSPVETSNLPSVPNLPASLAVTGIAGFGCFAVLAIMAPLATYTVTLAAFGLPHVLSELRYIDRRFGRRIARHILLPVAVLLPFIVAMRACVVFHLVSPELDVPAELGGVTMLALACARGSFSQKAVALLVAGVLGGATALAPFTTAVSLAMLHNLTPLGFLWQIAPRANRRRLMAGAAFAFIGLPLLVATGWPHKALDALLGSLPIFDPLHAGPLKAHLFVYVPSQFVATPQAIDFFTASVVAQGAHYASVIVILPLLLHRLDPRARGLVAWPSGIWFALLCIGAATLGLARSLDGFAQARALYGIVASIHAWIEIPVLIVALTGGAQPSTQSPNKNDPELATSETSRARSMRSAAIHAIRAPATSTTIASKTRIDGQ